MLEVNLSRWGLGYSNVCFKSIVEVLYKQDKYTMDPRYSNLSQQSENKFWSKVIFAQKNQKCINYAQLMPNNACHKHDLP